MFKINTNSKNYKSWKDARWLDLITEILVILAAQLAYHMMFPYTGIKAEIFDHSYIWWSSVVMAIVAVIGYRVVMTSIDKSLDGYEEYDDEK